MGWKINRLRDKASNLALAAKHDKAVAVYGELRALEPDEPRWPHKQGDLLRRLGRENDAVEAYEAAVDAYASKGFLARAAAMAKVILTIDPDRSEVLARVNPTAAQELRKKTGSGLYDARQLLEQAAAADAEKAQAAHAQQEAARQPSERPATPSEPAPARKRKDSSVFQAAAPLKAVQDEDDLIVFDDADVTNLTLSDQELSDPNERVTTASDGPDALQLAALPAMPLFADIPPDALRSLVSNAELVEVAAGTTIVTEGSAANALYVLTEGTARVTSPRVARPILLTEGEVFGESCLVDSGARQANVVAHTDVSALRIRKDTLDALCTAHPQLHDVLLELLTRRLVSNLMTTSPIFCDLPKEVQRKLATSFEIRRADPGTALIMRNKRADGMYLLLSGALELIDSNQGRSIVLNPGALVGTYSLLRKTGSLHDVLVKSPAIVLRLSATRFRMAVIESQNAVDHLRSLATSMPDQNQPTLST